MSFSFTPPKSHFPYILEHSQTKFKSNGDMISLFRKVCNRKRISQMFTYRNLPASSRLNRL
jgi:hypothetical protein